VPAGTRSSLRPLIEEGGEKAQSSGARRRENTGVSVLGYLTEKRLAGLDFSPVIGSEAKQSRLFRADNLDCFVAEPVIGPRFARTRWLLAMTNPNISSGRLAQWPS
jgi:hypothetical protein